jgi:alkylation response protein AidB-like acyl-CoA dehydrogenase
MHMDWADNAEQAAFRAEVKSVLASGLPELYKRLASGEGSAEEGQAGDWVADRKADDPERVKAAKDWGDALAARGWFAPQWPKEYGGGGLSPMEQFIFRQETAMAGAPSVGGSGVSLLGPTLIVHASEEQKKKYLPNILSGTTVYAQGYSEPGSGSDLASLQTRAVKDGDEYVLNGQKIWTSGAHHADALFALTRTDPDAPKHRGITFLVIDDIKTPGLTIRPLINMAWKHGFNETFFEDVRVPVANVIGEENRGWYVGATLLDFERSNISGAVAQKRTINGLLAYTKTADGKAKSKLSGRGGESTALRSDVAERYIETAVGENFSFRIISMQNRGMIPNYEASTAKMFISESGQRLQRTGTKVFGLYSNLWEPSDPRSAAKASFTQGYVTSVPATIAAGSSEIQRNIIATRGLGLPRG